MSLRYLIASDVTNVFMVLDDYAETIIRYVGGDAGNVRTFTGQIFIGDVLINDNRGRGYDHTASLVVSSSVILDAGDAIKHGGERYEVKAPGDVEHGMRTFPLVRYQPEVKGGKVFRNGDL